MNPRQRTERKARCAASGPFALRSAAARSRLRRPVCVGAWAAVCIATGLAARGQTAEIEIVKPGSVKSRLDLTGLQCAAVASVEEFRATLEADLLRSGWFEILAAGSGTIEVSGTAREADGALEIRCAVGNRVAGRRYLSDVFRGAPGEARKLAHHVADAIVRAVQGVPGIASTRIVMIGSTFGRQDLYMCDADGANVLQLTKDGTVCLSPAWAAEGRAILYTSFHGGFPDVYRINLAGGTRERIAAYPGLNAGAVVSPDGRSMALTLSKDGNPELYVRDIAGGHPVRLTRTRHAAEASPSWSPDGERIVFVSDRDGSPQLYTVGRDGGDQKRLVFRGSENVAPDWGPGGRIAYSSRLDGRYHICLVNPVSGTIEQLTSGAADYEDPSWAPDGRHIVCARTAGYHSDLYVLDVLGDPPVRLLEFAGEWYSPAWSPK